MSETNTQQEQVKDLSEGAKKVNALCEDLKQSGSKATLVVIYDDGESSMSVVNGSTKDCALVIHKLLSLHPKKSKSLDMIKLIDAVLSNARECDDCKASRELGDILNLGTEKSYSESEDELITEETK